MKKKIGEFQKFDATMRKLMSVSHDELKKKLDAEKAEKKPAKQRASRASDRASGGKG